MVPFVVNYLYYFVWGLVYFWGTAQFLCFGSPVVLHPHSYSVVLENAWEYSAIYDHMQ